MADKGKFQRPGDRPNPRLRIVGDDRSDPRRQGVPNPPKGNQKKGK